MAFDEDVPQPRLGPIHWAIAMVLISFLAMVLVKQWTRMTKVARRDNCLSRQQVLLGSVALWEQQHGGFPVGTTGYGCFTRKTGRCFKQVGLVKSFESAVLSELSGRQPWACPQAIFVDFQDDPARVPDDNAPAGLGNYCYVQDDKYSPKPPLSDYVGSVTPLRVAVCTVYGGKTHVGWDGRPGTRHSDHW